MSGLRSREREQERRDGIRAILKHIPDGYDIQSVGFKPPMDGYHVVLTCTSAVERTLSINSYDLPFILRYLDSLPSSWVPDDRQKEPVR